MLRSYKNMSKMAYPFYIIMHPFDGYNEMKHNKKGSIFISNAILFAWFFAEICRRQLTDFVFNSFRMEHFNVFHICLTTFIIFLIAVTANWCFCTLLDGKGKFTDIWVAGSYALLPMIIGILLFVILSKFLVLNEMVFLKYMLLVFNIWTIVLIIVALEVTHDYSFKKTLASIGLTVLGIMIIIFLIILLFSLYGQVFTFVESVFNEILYRL